MRLFAHIVFISCLIACLGAVEKQQQRPWPALPAEIVVADDATAAAAIDSIMKLPYIQAALALETALQPKITAFEKRFDCSVVVEKRSLFDLLMTPSLSYHLASTGQPHLLFYVSDSLLLFKDIGLSEVERSMDFWADRIGDGPYGLDCLEEDVDLTDEDIKDMLDDLEADDVAPERALRFGIVHGDKVVVLSPAQLKPLLEWQVVVSLDVQSLLKKVVPQASFESANPGTVLKNICGLIDADYVDTLEVVYNRTIDIKVRDQTIEELLTVVTDSIGWYWEPKGWRQPQQPIIPEDLEGELPAASFDWEPHPVESVSLPMRLIAPGRQHLRAQAALRLFSGEQVDVSAGPARLSSDAMADQMMKGLSDQMQGSWRPLITVMPAVGTDKMFPASK